MLGQELVRTYRDADVLAWDRENVDITDAVAVRSAIAAVQPDLVINAAAYNAVDAAEEAPAVAEVVNSTAVGVLAVAAATIGTTFVHYSTDFVFDGTKRDGYAEDDAPGPVNAYGRSKLLGERSLLEIASQFSGWRWYLIRTTRLFGRQGVSPNTKRSFVDTMVSLSATKDRLELIDEEVSSPTYAPDLAHATRHIIDCALPSGIYHRTNAGSCTWYGFAKEILRISNWRGTAVPVPASAFPRPAKRPAFSMLRTTKLLPMRRWEEALAEYLTTVAVTATAPPQFLAGPR